MSIFRKTSLLLAENEAFLRWQEPSYCTVVLMAISEGGNRFCYIVCSRNDALFSCPSFRGVLGSQGVWGGQGMTQ